MRALIGRALFAAVCVASLGYSQAVVDEAKEAASLYVNALTGNDTNTGTVTAPFKTIGAGIAAAMQNNTLGIGSRVTVNPGTYRESLAIQAGPKATASPITIQAAVNGTVLVSGALQYTNWAASGGGIYSAPWPNRWGFCPADANGAPFEEAIVLRREMIFVNNSPMTEVLALNQVMFPGTFFVDETSGLVYVWPPAGTNMATADVEVANAPVLLTINHMNGLVIRGLTFSYASSCHGQTAASVDGQSSNVLFDADSFNWNSGQGLGVSGPINVTIQNSAANHNGAAGFQSYQVEKALWQNDTANYNNWRGAQGVYYEWNTGGFHMYSDHGETINNSTSSFNQTHSIHWDIDVQNVMMDSFIATGNLLGALDEKSAGPVSVSNSAFCNSQEGFAIRNSGSVTLTGNTFYNNSIGAIFLTGITGGYVISDWNTTIPYTTNTHDITLLNNTVEGVGTAQPVFRDSFLSGDDWSLMQSTFTADNNTWWNSSLTSAFTVPVPAAGTVESFVAWQATTGQDAHSTFAAPATDSSLACRATADGQDWWLVVKNLTDTSASWPGSEATADVAGNATYNLANVALGGWNGTATLAIDGISAIPGASYAFSPSSPTMTANSLTALVVHFAPGTPADTYPVTVFANSGGITRTVYLSVTVPVTSVAVSTASLDFPNQPLNIVSPAQYITLTNTGAAPLGISSITATFGFTATSDCGASVGVGQNCTITITFKPGSSQPYSGSVTIVDTDVTGQQAVLLTGTTVGSAKLKATPISLSFGNVVYGKQSVTLTATVSNIGTADGNLADILMSNPSFHQTNSCYGKIPYGGSCVFSVTMTPQELGKLAGNLTFVSDASNNPLTITLAGAGVTSISVSPKTLAMNTVKVGKVSVAKTVTVTNLSTAALVLTSITLGGTEASQFAISSNTCGPMLAGGTACTFQVILSPTSAGVKAATVTIVDSDPTGSTVVSLSGTGS